MSALLAIEIELVVNLPVEVSYIAVKGPIVGYRVLAVAPRRPVAHRMAGVAVAAVHGPEVGAMVRQVAAVHFDAAAAAVAVRLLPPLH